jgi:hypothetical protein
MRCTVCGRPEHPQEVISAVAALRSDRLVIDIGIHISAHPPNLVVEFGDAAEEETIDQYVAGEDVPYQQLRRVWANTVEWFPTVTSLAYMNFFAEVKAVNLTLPPVRRIHIWLGDPPVDLSKVTTRADLTHVADRNQYPADLIKSTILAKNKKALVIYGWVTCPATNR